MAIHLLTRRRLRRWARAHGDPGWLSGLSCFLTMNVFVLAEINDGQKDIASVAKVFGSMTRSSDLGTEIPVQWGLVGSACAGAMLFQYVHHRLGGDFWMRSLGLLPRAMAGLVLLSLSLVLSGLPWP